jgi:hypothetical protein
MPITASPSRGFLRAPMAALGVVWMLGVAPASAVTWVFAQARHPFTLPAGFILAGLLLIGAGVAYDLRRGRLNAP